MREINYQKTILGIEILIKYLLKMHINVLLILIIVIFIMNMMMNFLFQDNFGSCYVMIIQ